VSPRPTRQLFPTAVLCLVILALGFAPAARAEPSCAVADALLNARLIDEADGAYRQALRNGASQCARAGLREIAAERARRARILVNSLESDGVPEKKALAVAGLVRRGEESQITERFKGDIEAGNGFAFARALKLAGYLETADQVVVTTIAANPDAVVPDDLKGLSDAGLELAAAKALADAGLDSAANTELQAAIEKNPNLDVPDELASPSRREPDWRAFIGEWGPRLRTAAEALIYALAAVALVLLTIRSLRRGRARLAIAPFTGDANTDAGLAMTAVLRDSYGRLTNESGGRGLGLVTSSGEASLVPPKEVVAISPQVTLIAALAGYLDRLIPSRTREVTGSLRPHDPRRGAGVTVALARRYGKQFGEVTLWEAEYGPLAAHGDNDSMQPSYDRLGTPAASWLMFTAGNRSILERIRFWRKFRLLGTMDWRSYAHFAVGAEDQIRGEPAANVIRRYLSALAHDPNNHGAALNLASTELGLAETDADLFRSAKTRLEQLRITLEDQPGDFTTNELWYRMRYNQTVAELHPEFGDEVRARETAVRLCAMLLTKLDRLRTPVRLSSRRLRAFLKEVKPTALVTLASALWWDSRPPDTMPGTIKPVEESVLREELSHLAMNPHDDGALRRFDAKVTYPAVVEYVIQELDPPNARTNYNLACFFTRADFVIAEEKWRKAEERLLDAIELGGPGLGARALVDASLESYREDRERLKNLNDAIQRVTEPKPASAAAPPAAKNPLERLVELLGG
jgi:hypothetical protein